MSVRDEVKLLGVDLSVDERSEHMLCPVCNGGSSSERTFIITRVDTGLLYTCHRASCPTKGFVSSIGSDLVKGYKRPKANKPKAKPYKRETVAIPDGVSEWLWHQFYITQEVQHQEGWKWNDETQRVVLPIRDVRRAELGHNARYWRELDAVELGDVGPKSITYWNRLDCVKYHMPFRSSRGGTLTLVEDQPSAVRLSQDTDTLALLGTHVTAELAREIQTMGYSRIVLALDNDATLKALKIKQQIGLFYRQFDVIPLEGPDIKDMTVDEYNRFLEVAYG